MTLPRTGTVEHEVLQLLAQREGLDGPGVRRVLRVRSQEALSRLTKRELVTYLGVTKSRRYFLTWTGADELAHSLSEPHPRGMERPAPPTVPQV